MAVDAPARSETSARLRGLLAALFGVALDYLALLKPRIILLLVVTDVCTMMVAVRDHLLLDAASFLGAGPDLEQAVLGRQGSDAAGRRRRGTDAPLDLLLLGRAACREPGAGHLAGVDLRSGQHHSGPGFPGVRGTGI
jgi:hypothetical protein